MEMPIKKLSRIIAKSILNNIEVTETTLDANTIERRISVLMIYIFLIVTLIPIGLIFDIMIQLILSVISLIFIRSVSGGNHFNSADTCYIVTASVILIVPIFANILPKEVDIYVFVASFIIYSIFSPIEWNGRFSYWSTKLFLLMSLVISSLIVREFLFMFLVLAADQMVNNRLYENKKLY